MRGERCSVGLIIGVGRRGRWIGVGDGRWEWVREVVRGVEGTGLSFFGGGEECIAGCWDEGKVCGWELKKETV